MGIKDRVTVARDSLQDRIFEARYRLSRRRTASPEEMTYRYTCPDCHARYGGSVPLNGHPCPDCGSYRLVEHPSNP